MTNNIKNLVSWCYSFSIYSR